jgi:hypothetical protein
MYSGHEFVSPAQSECDPLPANFQIALTAKPMWINPPAFALLNDFRALCDQIQRRDRQYQTQPLQRRRRADQRCLELKAIRFIIQEILFDIETSPILFKSLHIGWFITDHKPIFFTLMAPRHGQMDRTIPLFGNVDIVPEAGLSR